MFSVVTAVFNGASHLERTIASVAAQRGSTVEHIVIDGGSTDGTLDIIKSYANKLAYWASEPDRGIGDAMNKGIEHSRGEWLLFLHADDYLGSPDVLAVASQQLDPSYDLVAFGIDYQTSTGRRHHRSRGFGPWLNFKTGLWHQGVLINRRLFERIGLYDPSFRIAVDYEFFLHAYRRKAKLKLCPETILAVMREGGLSTRRDWPSLSQRLAEERAIHLKHCPNAAWRTVYAIYWALYPSYKRATAAS